MKTVTRDGDVWTVDMGVARHPRRDQGRRSGDRSWPAVHVDLGNPHAVVFVDDLAEAGRWPRSRRTTRRSTPSGVNVEFVVRRGADHLAMRVHERGSGETRSCGTGRLRGGRRGGRRQARGAGGSTYPVASSRSRATSAGASS